MITARQSRLRYAIVVCAAVVAAVFVAGSTHAAGLDLHARAEARDVGKVAPDGTGASSTLVGIEWRGDE